MGVVRVLWHFKTHKVELYEEGSAETFSKQNFMNFGNDLFRNYEC